jgi:hypothetical protein
MTKAYQHSLTIMNRSTRQEEQGYPKSMMISVKGLIVIECLSEIPLS